MGPSARPEVTRLPTSRWRAAADCLTRAFIDDPLWEALFPDAQVREERLTGLFGAVVRKATHSGLPLTTVGGGAVAIWQPPRRREILSMLRSGFAEERWLLGLPAVDRRRLTVIYQRLEERRRALLLGPYWYLEAVGVEPTQQGRGLGGALVRDGLTRADEADLPTYMETATEDLVSMYEHFGFRVLQEVQTPGLDLPIWLMRREPVDHPAVRVEQVRHS